MPPPPQSGNNKAPQKEKQSHNHHNCQRFQEGLRFFPRDLVIGIKARTESAELPNKLAAAGSEEVKVQHKHSKRAHFKLVERKKTEKTEKTSSHPAG